MKVKSDDRTIGEVLTAYFLRVPRFQRPYEWTGSEVEDFWDDITQAGADYFIGSMVLFPYTHGTQGIVDGQQRVTTITLLLCVIRDALRSVGANESADGLHNVIERAAVLDNKLHFVLQTEEVSPYLRHIQSGKAGDPPAATDAERLLRAAYVKLADRVKEMTAPDDPISKQALLDLRTRILGLRLIAVEVDNEDDATVIFQTLNSRGRDLDAADLVKSHLLSILKSSNPDNDPARDKWQGILTSFSDSKADLPMDRFLLHSWLSRYEYLARADLGKAVRKRVRAKPTGMTVSATDFLEGLVSDARMYREIHEPGFRDAWGQEEFPVREAFMALQVFRVRQPLPWLVSVWREYSSKNVKLKHVIRAVQAIERFHFIATAVTNQPSSGGVSKMYASHARQLKDATGGPTRVSVIEDLYGKLSDTSRLPTLEQFKAAFIEIRSSRIYSQQGRLALYILQRMHGAPAAPNFQTLTIEHVAPQGSTSGVTESEAARLGNLILIPGKLNEELADLPFQEKRRILQKASDDGVYIDPEVLQSQDWGVEQIAARGSRLAEHAYLEVWKLNPSCGSGERGSSLALR